MRTIISDGASDLYFSAASGWEIAIKAQLSKMNLPSDLEKFVAEQLLENDFHVLPIQLSHTLYVYKPYIICLYVAFVSS